MTNVALTEQPSKSVLITGASGFLGFYVIRALKEQGYQLHGIARSGLDLTSRTLLKTYHNIDINDQAALNSVVESVLPNIVIHLAGLSFVGHATPLDFYEVNVLGTENLLKALASIEPNVVEHVYLASSATVYGRNAKGKVDESIIPLPQHHYALSKLTMEQMAQNYTNAFPITALRFFNMIGIGQSDCFLMPKLVKHFVERTAQIELGNLDVSRDFSDVRDVANWLGILICNHQFQGDMAAQKHRLLEIINVASGVAVPIRSIILDLEHQTGHAPEILQTAELMRTNEIKALWGDNLKLCSIIGQVSQIPLAETLKWMID